MQRTYLQKNKLSQSEIALADGECAVASPGNAAQCTTNGTPKTILAPWYFEQISFELSFTTRTSSCLFILFILELSKHGHEWMAGTEVWSAIDSSRPFVLTIFQKIAQTTNCVEMDRRTGRFGKSHSYFRLKEGIHLVDIDGLNGKRSLWLLKALTTINCARPKQTPRIALLLYAIFFLKLINRKDIDEYLENPNVNASVIMRQLNVLEELKFIQQERVSAGYKSCHFVYPICT